MGKITEAVEKICALEPGSEREEHLAQLVILLDQDRADLHRQLSNSTTALALTITDNQALRAECQRLQSAAAVGIPA